MLAIFLWPFSPCLALYLTNERNKLLTVYRNESHLKKPTPCESVYYTCFWPINLADQRDFLNLMENQQKLVYEWDLRAFKDHKKYSVSPNIATSKVFLFGLKSAARQSFFKKLVGQSDSIKKQPDPATLDEKFTSLDEEESILVGVKSHHFQGNEIQFLEIWNIPSNFLESHTLRLQLASIDVAIFVFDLTATSHDHEDPIAAVMSMHEKLTNSFNPNRIFPHTKKICVAIIDEPKEGQDDVEDEDEADDHHHHNHHHHHHHHNHAHSLFQKIKLSTKTSARAKVERVRRWAEEEMNYDFFPLSLGQRKGFTAIHQVLSAVQ